MIKLIVFSVLLNTDGNIYAVMPSDPIKIEARRRGKQNKGDRRRGGGGLR